MNNIVDIHCHLIPGVDDGAKSYEMALAIIQKEYNEGVRAIILTPHFRRKMFEPDERLVYENYRKLKSMVKEQIPDLKLYLGCEFHASMGMVERINKNPYLCMAGTNYVLIEFSEADEVDYIRERIRAVQMSGYRPIIAHAERYPNLMKQFDMLRELADMGIWIQVNADSILGKEGWRTKRLCKKMMKENLIHLVGSDAHNLTDRTSDLGKCADFVLKKEGVDYAEELFITNPMRIIKAQEKKDGNKAY